MLRTQSATTSLYFSRICFERSQQPFSIRTLKLHLGVEFHPDLGEQVVATMSRVESLAAVALEGEEWVRPGRQ
jgi:hypothetical protein